MLAWKRNEHLLHGAGVRRVLCSERGERWTGWPGDHSQRWLGAMYRPATRQSSSARLLHSSHRHTSWRRGALQRPGNHRYIRCFVLHSNQIKVMATKRRHLKVIRRFCCKRLSFAHCMLRYVGCEGLLRSVWCVCLVWWVFVWLCLCVFVLYIFSSFLCVLFCCVAAWWRIKMFKRKIDNTTLLRCTKIITQWQFLFLQQAGSQKRYRLHSTQM